MFQRREFIRGAGLLAAGAFSPLAAQALTRPQGAANRDTFHGQTTNPLHPAMAPPPPNFASNHNYFIYGGGQPILGLVVTIDITEDLVAPQGLSLQLNANSPKDANCVWQQFVTGFSPDTPTLEIGASMENFPSKAFRWQLHQSGDLSCGGVSNPTQATCKGDLFNQHMGKFGVFPGRSDTLPAGFKIRYELAFGAGGVVTGADFSFSDSHGRTKSSGQKPISSFPFEGSQKSVGPHALAPILAVQLNIVGVNDSQFMPATAGAGTITYEAQTPLTALGSPPDTIKPTSTAESSSISYAELPAAPARQIVQTFKAIDEHSLAPVARTVRRRIG